MNSPFPSLRCFGNVAFGIALGLGGQSILWRNLLDWELLEDYKDVLEIVQWVWFISCILVFAVFIGVYLTKAIFYSDIVVGEFRHPIRVNFFCGPCIATLMITLSWPTSVDDAVVLHQMLWTFAFTYQLCAGLVIYHRWLYTSSTSDLAAAPYLLSIVSWFLLSVLGISCGIDDGTGVPLSMMCFGVGTFFSFLIYPFVLLGIYAGRTEQGSPALFLIIAPISVAGMALIGLSGGNHATSEGLFGIALFFFIFLLRSRPTIFSRPSVLGVYWAYVFPNAALASLSIKIARNRDRVAMDAIAVSLSIFAVLGVLIVFCRMSYHMKEVSCGRATWSDPIVVAMDAVRSSSGNTGGNTIGKEAGG